MAEFEPPVITRRPSGVYVKTVVPGVSSIWKKVVSQWFLVACRRRRCLLQTYGLVCLWDESLRKTL